MNKDDILQDFSELVKQEGDLAYTKITEFFTTIKSRFLSNHNYDSDIKARQAWVQLVGASLEGIIYKMLEHFCATNGLALATDKDLTRPKTKILETVRSNIEVYFDKISILPDGDLILYEPKSGKVHAIISLKNSFRERYTETPYWKLKLSQRMTTKDVKVFMITPDPDDEVSSRSNPRKPRIVMEYELDGIYLAKETSAFEPSDKVKSISSLIPDLRILLALKRQGRI